MKTEIDTLIFEKEYLSKGFSLIAGIDEAGRGPLAGPVTCACCMPDLKNIISGIDDSKKVTPKKREELFEAIKSSTDSYSIIDIDEKVIDKINILNATMQGMKKSFENVFPRPEVVLIDAVKLDLGVETKSIIHGDALSYCIAAASILAKVHRDKLMEKYAEIYPEYGFEKHKGYGTKFHIDMLKKYGPCPIHRKTFIKNFF